MDSVHSVIRRELCSFVSKAYGDVTTDIFDMDCPGAEISAPLGFRPGPDGAWWQQRLSELIKEMPPMLYGEKLIESISSATGHVLFHISDDAYSAIISHIIKSYPKPKMPEDTGDTVNYALARMLMLSRKGGSGCPASFKKGLWLCLCIEGFEGKKREALRKRAAETLLGAMEGLNTAERDSLREISGGCADCAARLLMINPQ